MAECSFTNQVVVGSNLVAVPLNLYVAVFQGKHQKFDASLLKTRIGEIFVQKPKSKIIPEENYLSQF